MTYGSAASGPVIPPAREGHRRKFSETDKRQIVEEAVQPGASLSEVARRYGIAARVLFLWKQELTSSAAPKFVTVLITDANEPFLIVKPLPMDSKIRMESNQARLRHVRVDLKSARSLTLRRFGALDVPLLGSGR